MAVPTAFRRAAVVLLIAGAAAALSFRAVYEPDLWYHLAQGRENLAGHVVRENTFSFTYPGYRQRYAPWLFDATLYGAWTAAGGAGVQAFQALFLAAAFALVYRAARSRAPAVVAFAVLLAGIGIMEPRAIPRPHLASFAALAACVVIIERAVSKGSASPLWWTVPLIALWSNLHVEAAFGAAVVGLFAAVELVRPSALPRLEARRALAIAAVCALATLANPYGMGLWQYLIENRTVTNLLEIAELQPPYLPAYRAFFLYLIVTGAVLALAPRGVRLWELAIVGLAAAAGLRYLRLTPLVFIVTAPILARQLGELVARGLDRRAVVVTAIALAVGGARLPVTAYVSSWQLGNKAIEPAGFFSPGAIDFIRRVPACRDRSSTATTLAVIWHSICTRTSGSFRIRGSSRTHPITSDGSCARRRRRRRGARSSRLSIGPCCRVRGRMRCQASAGFQAAEWATVFRDEAIEIVVRRGGKFGTLAKKKAE